MNPGLRAPIRRVLAIVVLIAVAQAHAGPANAPYTYVHHVVSTDVPAAQFQFDRGLTMVLAYQTEEAELAFRQAARLDPSLAMAWWGIGLAQGPNINSQPDAKGTAAAADALARAQLLAATRATALEHEYIDALAVRYSSDPKPDFDHLARAYRDAMKTLVEKHPGDADAASLYAEAIMDLRPWSLWDSNGAPAPDTQELVAVLERGLARSPNHVGLLHFYIHAVEGSNDPGRALPVARRLAALPMEPAAAHLVHMPAHIYMRVGDWSSAITANEHSVHHALDYRLSGNPKMTYACGHCVDFLTYAHMMLGNQAQARQSADDFQKIFNDPTNALAVLVRFHQWEDVLSFPEPAADLKTNVHGVHFIRGFWHFARGLAFAASTRLDRAQDELSALRAETALAPARATPSDALDVEHSLDKKSQTEEAIDLDIAAAILGARLAQARGQMPEALQLTRNAVDLQDRLPYGEPPAWFYPVRESLGALLLQAGKSAEAEAAFREDLERNPHNPRSLFGLAEALRTLGRADEAAKVRSEFDAAWRNGDPKLALSGL